MRFIEIINDKKFSLLSIFLFIYVILNLLDGERGLISFYEKQKIKNNLINKKESLIVAEGLLILAEKMGEHDPEYPQVQEARKPRSKSKIRLATARMNARSCETKTTAILPLCKKSSSQRMPGRSK